MDPPRESFFTDIEINGFFRNLNSYVRIMINFITITTLEDRPFYIVTMWMAKISFKLFTSDNIRVCHSGLDPESRWLSVNPGCRIESGMTLKL